MAALLLVAVWGVAGVAGAAEAPKLTDEEFEQGKFIYFDRCSGCHGALRKGATGPNISDQEMLKQTTGKLEKTIFDGTDAGMPGWGRTGEMTRAETALMAKYVQLPAPIPPELGLKEMKATHKLHVPVAERPRKPEHKRDIDNLFGFILRDVGKGAVIDGDTKELVGVVDTGFAVHIFRASATGRYFYTIGRDGKVSLIDLYEEEAEGGGRGQGVPGRALRRRFEVQGAEGGLRRQAGRRRLLLAAADGRARRPDPRAAEGHLDPFVHV